MRIMQIPTLHTERLILREQRPADTEALVAAFADESYSRFITRQHRALTREEAWMPIAVVAGSWAAMGYGQWVAEERAGGRPVGRIGPWAPEGWPDFEIAWSVFPDHQGRGYAVEGAAAAMVWVHEALGREYVIHLIDPLNTPSEKVALALGAEIAGTWKSSLADEARIWTTRWDRFVETEAYRRYAAASA